MMSPLPVPTCGDRTIIHWFVLFLLGDAQVINGLVEIIKDSLQFIVSSNQNHFIEKYEALAHLYDLPSLDAFGKYYYFPNIKF